MRSRPIVLPMLFAATLTQAGARQGASPAPEAPVEVAPGVHLIRGAEVPGRGPDGNTIVLEAPAGLIVIDSGRHTYHSDAILAFARARQRPIAAIVNTHWHLDHSSGNGRLKAAFPKAPVYTTRAVDRTLAEGGFLQRDLESVRPMLTAPGIDDVQKDEIRIFLDTMAARGDLRPDVPVERTGPLVLAGRRLEAHVTDGAVTDSDLWMFDIGTKVAIIGDLVTIPVPYFETACPDRWRAAMDEVWATPFEIAIPGHGRPLTRPQFDTYRTALGAFVACARSDRAAAQCGASWVRDMDTLVGDDSARRKTVASGIEYYVGYLRDGAGKAPDCRAH